MSPLRWWRYRKACELRRMRQAEYVAELKRLAAAAIVEQAASLRQIHVAARERAYIARTGQCAYCGTWNLVVRPLPNVDRGESFDVPMRSASTCKSCGCGTVMVGATDAGR